MQKAFYSDDIMEFKINHKWSKGKLKDILIDQNKYVLFIEKGEDKLEYQNPILLINNYDAPSLIKKFDENFSPNQRVEFFEESNNSWTEGIIKTKNNDFYLISYSTKTNLNNSKILFKNNIRSLTNDRDLLKLDLNKAQGFSLKNFETLSNPKKYAKKFIKKLIKLLNDKIFIVFLNNNLDLFIFSQDNEKENNIINKDVIDGLIDVAVKHFKEMDRENKKLFK
jgi:hypothetical protein